MTYTLIPKLWYTITPETDCDIDTPNGISIHLPAGIQYFHFADSVSIDISGTATVTQNPPLFKPASASALGGGYFESDLNIGHGAADAVQAVCTLTLGAPTEAGTLTDGTTSLTLPAQPELHATGGITIIDPTKGGTLAIGDWSKTWEAKADAKAGATFYYMNGAVTVDGTPVTPPTDPSSVEGWNDAFRQAGAGIVCTAASMHGETDVTVEAAEFGEYANGITISAEGYEDDVVLAGGSTARTREALLAELAADVTFPCEIGNVDEQGYVNLTAKAAGEAGNYNMSCTDRSFIDPDAGLGGGQDARTYTDVISAINEETGFAALAEATETEGAVTLTSTATEHQAAANRITYTATGCFGSGSVQQGSSTRGRNAVQQTARKIYLNGAELDVEPAPVPTALTASTQMVNRGVYTVAAIGSALDFSGVSIPANATAEIWFACSAATSVTWPAAWTWLEGSAPSFGNGKSCALAIRNDGTATICRVAYEYSTPAQS